MKKNIPKLFIVLYQPTFSPTVFVCWQRIYRGIREPRCSSIADISGLINGCGCCQQCTYYKEVLYIQVYLYIHSACLPGESKYISDINGNRSNNEFVNVYSQISVIILAVCILFFSFVFEFHANCILCWIYGINFGAFRYTFKMLVLERIKTKQFARVWGKLKSFLSS